MNEHEDSEYGAYMDEPHLAEDLNQGSPITSIVLQIEIMAVLGRWWK